MFGSFFVHLRIAFMNLVEHRSRTALLAFAIAATAALFVLMGSLSAGVDRTVLEAATGLWTGHVNVSGVYKSGTGRPSAAITDYPSVARVVEQALPELDFWVERHRGLSAVVSENSSVQTLVSGVDVRREKGFSGALRIQSGDVGDLAKPNTILLFEGQARKLDVRVGDAVTLSAQTPRGVANTVDCRVVAIARDSGMLSRWNAFVPTESARLLFQTAPGVAGTLQFHVRDGNVQRADALSRQVSAALAAAGYRVLPQDSQSLSTKLDSVAGESWKGQALQVNTWREEVSFLTWPLAAMAALRTLLTAVMTIIVVAGVTNALWISIRERTREIGTLRAIGMQRGGVLRAFFLEATLLAFGSAVLGALAGLALAAGLDALSIRVPAAAQIFLMSDTVRLSVEPSSLSFAVALLTVVTGAAALYPASRAARLRPATAMSHFG